MNRLLIAALALVPSLSQAAYTPKTASGKIAAALRADKRVRLIQLKIDGRKVSTQFLDGRVGGFTLAASARNGAKYTIDGLFNAKTGKMKLSAVKFNLNAVPLAF